MKKKYILYLFLPLLLFSIHACNKSAPESWIMEKAESVYREQGMMEFEKYVEKNCYFPVVDTENNGATPLLVAIQNKNLDSIILFLEKGASLDEQDSNGRGVLDYALQNLDEKILNYIVPVLPQEFWNTKDKDGDFPFVKILCNCDNYETIKRVIELTQNIDEPNNAGKTPLMYAAQCNTDLRVLKLLLDKAARKDRKSSKEWTSLMYAARYNPNPLVLKDLLLRGADFQPNSVGLTLIMLASCNPNPGVLMTLSEVLNDFNAKTDRGKTALMYACENGQPSSVITFLIDRKVNVNAADENKKTALMYALANYKISEPIYLLLAAGAECNACDKDGKDIKEYLKENPHLKTTMLEKTIDFIRQNTGQDIPQRSLE